LEQQAFLFALDQQRASNPNPSRISGLPQEPMGGMALGKANA
jgi:hypothetical protein